MIRRLLCRIADWLADTEWLRGMRATELEAERSAWRHERALRVDGIGDRVRVPEGRE